MRFALPAFDFYHRMSTRERLLSLLVGGTLLFIGNLVAISTLLRSSRDLRAQIAEKSQDLHIQNLYAQEQPMWKQRTAWLKAKQPVLANYNRAGTDLLGAIQTAARTQQVIINTFQITPLPPAIAGERVAKPEYQPVSVSVETQSDWAALVQFLATLQRPEEFLVFDRARLTTDPNDPSRMKGSFLIAKWYAPGTK